MEAPSLTLPRLCPSFHQNFAFVSQSGCSMPSAGLSYRPQVHPRRFAASAVLYSDPQVNQSVKFVDTSEHGNLTPLCQCIYADQLTPVLAYRCLVNENDHETPSFLFESVDSEMETSTLGRYSVIGANPVMEIIAKENSVIVVNHLEGWKTEEHSEEPLEIARRITERLNPRHNDELPEVFCGGWVGYFSYDTVRYSEKSVTFSNAPAEDSKLPDVYLGLYDDVLVFDHIEKKIYVIHWVQLDRFSSTEEAIDNGKDRLESLMSKVYDIVNPRLSAGSVEVDAQKRHSKVELISSDSETYKKAILKANEHIEAGDILQLALSQRFVRRTFSNPFEVYRTLSMVNPSPFMAYLQVRGSILVASSHETLTHVEPKRKTINGSHTWSGGRMGRLDHTILGKQYFNGEKHYRQQNTLADLANNDVRKITDVASTCWDALQNALPLEAVTGAPKINAMKLIDELEVNRRGLYGGGIGSISFSGNMDIALSPRTIVFPTGNNHDTLFLYEKQKNRREWVAHIQAGATIVPDSDLTHVAQECQSEADLVARAIDLAESSFLDKDSY